MKKLIISSLILLISTFSYGAIDSKFKVIESKNTLEAQNLLLDINKASKSDMLKSGISQSYVDKIIEYRDITGGYKKLNEMTRISGIGKKTYEKLKVKFKEPQSVKLNRFNINKVDDKTLIYYGFTKKEIQNIRKYHEKSIIRNNLELKNIISTKKYEELKDYIEY
ncbi:helix-hairpin-helix domain-containing protein [Cetobacterium somerae]|uniref:helix-hairpin-helix domain-containing protein n=1 Tax=Cetobacterium sp. NK01 TaxID=2993530 RepID=UPI002115D496|nr:helix-hairpin-helix domain-containing protein [Cetobacterium sp. NK01]MCQ8211993.1 helix-hairpin-helix domain-containing protein [Cetobacterium sp. NK01]